MSALRDEAAERAVLGSVLLSDVAIPRLVVDIGLTAGAFYDARLGRVWDAMVGLHMGGDRVDPVSVAAAMRREDVGHLLADLSVSAPAATNVMAYGRTVVEMAEWRRVQDAGMRLVDAAATQNQEDRADAERVLMTAKRATADTRGPEALAQEVWRHLSGEHVKAWRTPWDALDSALGGGLHAGRVTLVGGWTSDGKSVLVDQMLVRIAAQGARVHLYINEMSPASRARRIVSMLSGVKVASITDPARLSHDELGSVTRVLNQIPFGITQISDWTAEDVARHIRFQAWDVCAVDLIHLLPFNDERELAQASRVLNAAARTCGTHLLGVVHLNELRSTTDVPPPPALRDIRGSGMLKNDADNVLFIYRHRDFDVNNMPVRTGEATLMLEKCRDGRLVRLALEFDGPHVRFTGRPALTEAA